MAQPNHPVSHDEIIQMVRGHEATENAHRLDLRPLEGLESRLSRVESRMVETVTKVASLEDAVETLKHAEPPTGRPGLSGIETVVLSALVGFVAAGVTLVTTLSWRRKRRAQSGTSPTNTSKSEDETDTTTNEEADMPRVVDTKSNLRVEIREANSGRLYFAVFFRSNNNLLMKSDDYANNSAGMEALLHALHRAGRELVGALEVNRLEEGRIGDPAPKDPKGTIYPRGS